MTLTKITAGFIPLVDAAPLIVAQAFGMAAEEGLEIDLVKEKSWANVRDRLAIGHFEVAHLLAPLAIAGTLGLPPLPAPVVAPMALGSGRNVVTLSHRLAGRLADLGIAADGTPQTAAAALKALIAERGGDRPLVLAVVHPFSAHAYFLRYWLRASGIDPETHVSIEVVPPPYMVDALKSGRVDAGCVGEPWATAAQCDGVGQALLPCDEIWTANPDKVLAVQQGWAAENEAPVLGLVRAVRRAAIWCDDPANRDVLIACLAMADHLDRPAEELSASLSETFVGFGRQGLRGRFAAGQANFPWRSHALWFYRQMVANGQAVFDPAAASVAMRTFRPDLYRAALAGCEDGLPDADMRNEGTEEASRFFDGGIFDADSAAL